MSLQDTIATDGYALLARVFTQHQVCAIDR